MSKNMLIADDLLNATAYSKERSRLIHEFSSELAQKLKASAKLLYVKDTSRKEETLNENQTREEVAAFFAKRKVRLQFVAKTGSPVEEILRAETSSPRPSLIVMGTHGKTGLDRLFLGSVAEEVIRHSSTPVLILGPQVKDTEVKTGGKILVATDLTKNSRRAEAYALKLAAALKAEVVFYHSLFETIRTADQYAAMSGSLYVDDTFIATLRKKSGQALKDKVKQFRAKRVKASFIMDEKGSTSSEALVEEASKGYQFLIMGTHGRNSFVSAFVGSTARQTLISTSIPTVIVRSRLK
ncbi:universal stress protein [Bdellovibrio sp. NC01]|uniref:universal stress protein n=1 Tax=Bdellovibrio sp. NC01 TaxID=2220073 RepID=UPI0011598577|nr:universal stress protein [Bdellovibrio sp. NC01]QDK36611.1 hypothetical protein DOE51_02850 [Bdellovibrio sp. NC01]